MDGDNCRACKRQVHDITNWSDARRAAFLSACRTEVCVSYRLPMTAAAMVAVAAAPLPVAAECPPMIETVVYVGGLIDLENVEVAVAHRNRDVGSVLTWEAMTEVRARPAGAR